MSKSRWSCLALASLCPITLTVLLADDAPSPSEAVLIQETFADQPSQRGWTVTGDTSLFHWDAQEKNLAVTWDSSKSNSFFHIPLNTILSKEDSFELGFSMRLDDITIGTTAGKPFTFEIAVGFLNLTQATNATYLRGTGMNSPNLLEWDYFPDSGFGASLSPTLISGRHQFATTFIASEVVTNTLYQFLLRYDGVAKELVLERGVSGLPLEKLGTVSLKPDFDDFRLDTLSVTSYTDAGQDPQWGGSILSHGVIYRIDAKLPPPPVRDLSGAFTGGGWQTRFTSRTNWVYTLETSSDLRSWAPAVGAAPGTGAAQVMADPEQRPGAWFYRVRAEKP